jgi:phage protein D
MLEKKKHDEEGEREIKEKSGKIKSKRKMDECRAEWKGQRHTDKQETKKERRKRRERIKEPRYNRKYERERCTTEEIPEYLGRENAKERKMTARCRMSYEEKEIIEHMWNGCSEMRERERKERREMLNEDGREIR